MASSDSAPHPPRGLRVNINDLLNPIHPSDVESDSPRTDRSYPSSAASSVSSAHTPILPGFSSIGNFPHDLHAGRQSQTQSDVVKVDAAPRSDKIHSRVSGAQHFKDTELTGHARRASLGDTSFNLRSAQWMPTHPNAGSMRPTLPPLQPMYNLKTEPWQTSPFSASPRERDYTGDAADRPSRGAYSRPMHRSVLLPSPSSPASPQRVSPVTGFATSHPNVAPAMMAIPHSPYGRQDHRLQQANYSSQPVLGPQTHTHSHLSGRSPVYSPTMTSSEASPKNEYYGLSAPSIDMGVADTPAFNLQASERASVRLAVRGSKTPTPESSATRESAFVLQLHPTGQAQQARGHRKRTRSNAGLNSQASGLSSHRSSSLSSSSSADSTDSRNDRTEDGDASKAKKVRGKTDLNTASAGDFASKRLNGSEGATSEASGFARSSRKNKQKEKPNATSSRGHTNGHIQPFPSHATIPHGYGVAVVPVREGLPMYPVGFTPYPMPMHMHPLGVPVALATAQNQPFGLRLFPELQYARCMSARYKADPFPRCVSCTRRWAGDTCRFQNIRILLRDGNKVLWAVGFQDLDAKTQGPLMLYPDQWNVPLEKRHVDRLMETVAMSLLPHLRKERAHQRLGSVVRRQRETDVRATCDTCMTSLFSSSWMCRQCGREACEECFETIRRLTAEPTPAANHAPNGKSKVPTSPADQRAMKERHAQANPFFLSCNRKAEHGVHTFVPVTRFSKAELDNAVMGMERLVNSSEDSWGSAQSSPVESSRSVDEPETSAMQVDLAQGLPSSSSIRPTYKRSNSVSTRDGDEPVGLAPEHYNDGICTLIENPIPPRPCNQPSELPPTSETTPETPNFPVPYYTSETLTETVFAAQWARGTPLVVTGLLERLKLRWTPEYFIDTYGAQSCIVIECQSDANKKVTVGEFFGSFGRYEGRTEFWKLKDWPPSADFKSAFPELYEDFNRAVPVPSYTRRDGAYNIASHFPTNTVAPDLGPKMYNAYASSDTPGSKGTTRLHMDMADAVNIMLHAERTPDGAPGCAAWDIFRAEDSAALRAFFKKNFKGQYQNDPIHAQQFYLDPILRAQLFKEYGVRSFRIYQRPGEAVFIPAGCAHQVCNLSDSIKAACDFVSPENVERCETLTREFRAQNQSLVWKEDVLQLRSMMWFAWLSCRRQQERWAGQDSGLESAVAHTTISSDDSDKIEMETGQ